MAHVTLTDRPDGLVQRYAWRYSRKMFGHVVEPVQAAAHHNGVLMASGALETVVAKKWTTLDPPLAWLAQHATSIAIGCSWCVDYGYYEGVRTGVPMAKVREVGQWRDSDLFDERERLVLEYAEAVNATPSAMTDDLAGRLRQVFSEQEMVELAGWVALENMRSRFNAGLGLRSEGFSDKCEVPMAVATT
ncbi:MAG TPA: carboxymuconolactone decarboxylase family protein [Mycobacteriales bacterium]|nr:carboxymuconolactone decarboxylase family protein [Mycobacteriales bacterium]